MSLSLPIHGRGAAINPPNRFEPIDLEPDAETLESDAQEAALPRAEARSPKTQFFHDNSKSIIAYNDSPDIGFDASINPYRGCEHGCAYCYARPFHEYLGLSAGLDFETKIFCKLHAADLLRKELAHKSWKPQTLAMCGVTDAYQPVERRLRLSRKCLEVLRDFRNPVGIVTKNHLVTRDIDLLSDLARHNAAAVYISVTSLRNDIAMKLEPRASAPAARIDAIRQLATAGVPVGVMIAPIIGGLTDSEIPAILAATADAGAKWAHLLQLRLPGAVQPIFLSWLERHYPDRKDKIINRVLSMRGGKLNDPKFHSRFKGDSVFAEQMADMFRKLREKHGMVSKAPKLSTEHFRNPDAPRGLFD